MSDSSEKWLPIAGWEGLYEVSDLGRVRSLPRPTARGIRGGKILKPNPNGRDGYSTVALCCGDLSRRKTAFIYRLVAAAFLPPKLPGEEIRHGPGGKADDSLANLSYGTHIENTEDKTRDGTGKLNRRLAAEIRARRATGELRRTLAKDYGVSLGAIDKVLSGERWYIPLEAS